MLNGITSAPGRIHPLPPSPVSRGRWRGIPLEDEGDYRGHGRGRAGEVRAASVVLLPCVPSSVATARGRIAAELRGAGLFPTAVADAALVVSELLSNAILHARPLPDACIRVSWILTPGSVEIIVSDGGGATRPRASHPSLSSIGGRGPGHRGAPVHYAQTSRAPPCGRSCLPRGAAVPHRTVAVLAG